MAFDGITIANITKELQDTLTGGRISKIAQPEKDELLLTIKSSAGQFRLCIFCIFSPGELQQLWRLFILCMSIE